MPQKHDLAWRKRQQNSQPEPTQDTDALAKKLVERGLATPFILDRRFRPEKDS